MEPGRGPVDLPPCIRQRPFFIAAARHGVPFLVFAPQRGHSCIASQRGTGLEPLVFSRPLSSDVAHHRLPTGSNIDMFDDHLLRAFASTLVQSIQ